MPSYVCIGSGLTTDGQGRLTLSTPDWPFAVAEDGVFSQPLGLAADGRVYAPPRQIVVTDYYAGADTPALNLDLPDTTNADGFSRTFYLAQSNPDPGRRLHGMVLVEVDVRVSMEPGAVVSVGALGNEAHRWRNDATTTQAPHFEFTRTVELSVPPGGSQTVSWDVFTGLSGGAATVTQIYNTARVLAVTSQPV